MARWSASSSSRRADSAKRGRAISFATRASVALASIFFDLFFLVMAHDDIRYKAIQFTLERYRPIDLGHFGFLSSGTTVSFPLVWADA